MQAFEALESTVPFYSRSFPATFSRARGSFMLTEFGQKLIDFSSGAGTLNYGHNNHQIKSAIAKCIASDSVAHGPDMATPAKLEFMKTFSSVILQSRDLQYGLQFTEPADANAIDSALMLSRRAGRQHIISFTHGCHGMSSGVIAASGNHCHRTASGDSFSGVTFTPCDGSLGPAVDTVEYPRKALMDESSGIDRPAAIVVETVQGRGINVAGKQWLQSIQAIAKSVGAHFIVDDIQMDCGRAGDFFSLEFASLSPDIVVLSKSLSEYGLLLSTLLIREGLDAWRGEHIGSFRGSNLVLVSATANLYRRCRTFSQDVQRMGEFMRRRLEPIASEHGIGFAVGGRGMAFGFDCQIAEVAGGTIRKAFQKGLIVERCGPADQVIEFLPALTIDSETRALRYSRNLWPKH